MAVLALAGCTPGPSATPEASTAVLAPLATSQPTFAPGSLATSPPMDVLPPPRPTPGPTPTTPPVTKPKAVPVPVHHQASRGSGAIVARGYATWYRTPGLVAAAGPTLRRALGKGWRGERVLVCSGRRCLEVRLTDWCACGKRHGVPTVLDLSDSAFAWLQPLSRGVIRVTVQGFR